MREKTKIIRPQDGYQMMALSSPADIVIGGGAAGVGKTFSLLLEPLRNIHIPNFGAVFFRRTSPQIRAEGGLWDSSQKLYSMVSNATPKESTLQWIFDKSQSIKFSHLEYEKNIYDWQGSEIPLICFDELTHFTQKMFFYLLSRNRSTCGVKPYVRATCNPDPDSWVASLIDWWIGEDGFPIAERQGKVRWFFRDGDTFIWGDTIDEVYKQARYIIDEFIKASNGEAKKEDFIKSLTFIGGSIYDNKELLKVDPGYLGNLAAQDEDTRNQLLEGNWKVAINPLDVYEYYAFQDMYNNDFVCQGERKITVDVALEGQDKLIINYFNGDRWEDIKVIPKSSGKDVIDEIKQLQRIYQVRNSRIVYDADGVGGFIGGQGNAFIPNAFAFHNGGKAYKTEDKRIFFNLKTQCFVFSGEKAKKGQIYISEKVANTMYDNKMTVRQRLNFERKAIKLKPKKDEESTRLISKDEMKSKYLNGTSTDLLDSLAMNEVFELSNAQVLKTEKSLSEMGISY
ncbi:terminase large subunit domain-containing protein [Aquimarina sp. 2201CG5-10]|uniref:terminase large subunit domain-containing protein n=1 Tax=Aquimarina callyspongiae TaxID=3098150 RepID=UPI002AB3F333|nr:terminase family protein [Aquimarina sp. 2201CG5-10]MDY8137570.1 terminase family protein [Aquimarina sp. 2201CG5-10]